MRAERMMEQSEHATLNIAKVLNKAPIRREAAKLAKGTHEATAVFAFCDCGGGTNKREGRENLGRI
jgi:hypothetical protein